MGAPALDVAAASAAPAASKGARSKIAAAAIWTAWGLSAALMLGFLAQPVGATAQLALCGTAMAGMLALWLLFPRRGLARMAFLALGTLVVIRYVYWRMTGTLPGIDDPVSFGLGLVLLAAELYCVLILTVSLIINVAPLERAAAPVQAEADLPTVDIFVPSYNEGSAILAVTLAAARNLDYPEGRATVWLLDDGGTDQKCADANPEKAAAARARRAELQALCADLGARYLTRARNEHAKAGNLNGGLKHSAAEIVLVLDADHAPFRSFLRETVGLFSTDPKLFLVQTPHVFLNPDPVERNLRTFGSMPSENEMFYGVTQAGLDKWNGSFFCGSAALLRRAALDEVGGFSGITITEDCETAFELHSRGWTSAYVDKPLIAGLQPETFSAFIGQRARWCQGMFQIMLLKNPLFKRGLKPIQRLCYLSSMTFWFFPLPRLIFMLAPLLHIFLDVKIFVSSIDEALAFTATYVVANMMIQNYLYGHVRWPWISELYEYVQGVYLARSIASVLVSPRKPSFNVTSKGVSLDRDHLSPLAWPFFAIFGALAAGCGTAAWRYLYEPGVTSLMLVVGLWCLFNLVIAGAALGVVAERRQPERCPSLAIARGGRVSLGLDSFEVAVDRVAADGCTLRRRDGASWPEAAADGTLTVSPILGAPRHDAIPFRLSDAPRGDTRAVAFAALSPGAYRALADLMYGDATPLRDFLSRRRRHRDLFTGSLRVLAWGFGEPIRAISYALRRTSVPQASAEVPSQAASILRVPATIEAAVAIPDRTVAAAAAPASPTVAAIMAAWTQEFTAASEDSVTAVAETAAAPAPHPAVPAHTAEATRDHGTAAPASAAVFADRQTPPVPLTGDAWKTALSSLTRAENIGSPEVTADPGLDPIEWLAAILVLAGAEAVPTTSVAEVPVARLPLAAAPAFSGRPPAAAGPAAIRNAA